MTKKKEIKLTRTAGETVESGDVNFSYNNVLIGSLSDSGTAVLKTENTVVKHDIEVEYTKPEPTAVTIPVYYRLQSNTVLINNTPALPGTKMSFEIDKLTIPETIISSETGWTDDTMTDYTTDSGINAEFSTHEQLLTVNFYQPKEIPTGKTRYVISLGR